MLVGTIFPVFFAFYLGAWCDLFGRKLLFKIFLIARCLDQVVVILCAYFLESPKEYLLLSSIPTSLGIVSQKIPQVTIFGHKHERQKGDVLLEFSSVKWVLNEDHTLIVLQCTGHLIIAKFCTCQFLFYVIFL